MDAPPIRYAQADDGTSLAWWSYGAGEPLLLIWPPGTAHCQLAWTVKPFAEAFTRLGESHRLISYDPRNTGLSSRGVTDLSLEAQVTDALTVLGSAGVGRASVFGLYQGTKIAIGLAAKQPEHVERLVLWAASGVHDNYQLDVPGLSELTRLSRVNYELYAGGMSCLLVGHEEPDVLVQIIQFTEAASDEQNLLPTMTAISRADVSSLLGDISADTLIVHETGGLANEESSRSVAAMIPSASMVVVESERPMLPFQEDFVRRALEFLSAASSDAPERTPTQAFQTIMFTDLESSTALTQRVGDEAAQDVLHGHNDAVRKALADNGGREVKHTGDGIMAAFPSAVRAVEAALQIQRDLAGGEVRVRIGLNAGEPIAEDDDFFGTAVQLAARVCDRAEPGQVLVSNVVRELCAGKKLAFTHHSDATLKGFDEPVALFEVGG
jgi:class 3 adenylate cyclase